MAKKITGFNLSEDVLFGIKKLAKRDQRTVSNYVDRVLAKHLRESGFTPTANGAPEKNKTLKRNRRKRNRRKP